MSMGKRAAAPTEFDPGAEAERNYLRHMEILEALRTEWESLGRPLTSDFKGQGTVAHPVLKELQRAEALADRLLKTLRPRQPVGRPRGANSAPDRVARIRMVE
jgi:hypothetical protein